MSESQYLLNTLRTRLKEIFDIERRLRELLNRLRDAEFPGAPHAASHADGGTDELDITTLGGYTGTTTEFLRADGNFATPVAIVTTAAAGALDGDGSIPDPLAVRVDGETIIINGDNELSAVPPPATNVPTNDTFLVSGGQVVWVSSYTFLVSAATYYINGILYASPQTLIALSAADPTDDRIDVIIVDDNGLVDAVEGTPAAQPAEPDVDPGSQLKLAIVLVEAASSQPGGATSVTVYAENAGGPGEWNWTSSGSGWNLASTNNPRSGSVDIEATNVSSGALIQGQIASGTFDPNEYDFLVIYIRSKATWANNRTLLIRLQNAGVVVGSTLTIAHGTYGFDSSNTTAYQQVAIPVSFFSVPAGQVITQVRLTRQGPSNIGFYLDDISFIGSGTSVPGGGLTQEQADARYAPLGPAYVTTAADATLPNGRVLTAGTNVTVDLSTPGQAIVSAAGASLSGTAYPLKFTGDGQGSDIATGVKPYSNLIPPADYDGAFVAAYLWSPQTGDIEIDVLKNGVSITDGNYITLSGASSEVDLDLSDWDDVAVSGDDLVEIEVISCAGIEFFNLQLIAVRA